VQLYRAAGQQTRPAGGHVAPLLLETEEVEQLVTEFWSNATPRNGIPGR
jgi:hypothetical protein